jgi:chromatin segregation and condensation protein Rec8/ScpA/Scc1 (kleisin family)
VRERMIAVMELLDAREVIEFEQLFHTDGQVSPSRTMVVVTFLAILELVRLNALSLYQGLAEDGVPEGPIHLRSAGASQGEEWRQHVSTIT